MSSFNDVLFSMALLIKSLEYLNFKLNEEDFCRDVGLFRRVGELHDEYYRIRTIVKILRTDGFTMDDGYMVSKKTVIHILKRIYETRPF
jgi:hypothetical protein